jgi:hypothetical protein
MITPNGREERQLMRGLAGESPRETERDAHAVALQTIGSVGETIWSME